MRFSERLKRCRGSARLKKVKELETAGRFKQHCIRDADSGDRTGDREIATQRVLRTRAAFARAPFPGMGPPDRGRRPKWKAPRGLSAPRRRKPGSAGNAA